MSSPAFERFRNAFFIERRDPREGPPTDEVLQLEGQELAEAENLLLAALEKNDSWAVVALGKMRSQRAAEPLKQMFHHPFNPGHDYSDARVQIALALWQIESYPPAFEELRRIVRARPNGHADEIFEEDARLENGSIISEFDRVDAVIALREVRTRESVQTVIEALDDPSQLVRSNAVTSLAIMCGPYPLIEQHATAIMSADPAKRERTKQAIRSLIPSDAPPPALPEGYAISYALPDVYDYIHYREAGKLYAFHVAHTANGVIIRTGNYLAGMLGKAVNFSPGERERIVPRLRKFFEEQQMIAQCLPDPHPPEPKSWSQEDVQVLLPGKSVSMFEVRILTIPILRMKASRLPFCGALLAGTAGFVVGKFIHLLCDTPQWSVWAISAGFALAGMWVGQKFREELDEQ